MVEECRAKQEGHPPLHMFAYQEEQQLLTFDIVCKCSYYFISH